MEPTGYNTPNPVNARISACTVEDIMMNMEIFPFVFGSRRAIIVKNPDVAYPQEREDLIPKK